MKSGNWCVDRCAQRYLCSMRLASVILLLICLSGKITFSQDVRLLVNGVEEQRYIDDRQGQLRLLTMIADLKVDAGHLVKIKEITHAVDDKGTSLKRLDGPYFEGAYNDSPKIAITLGRPRRQASKLKKVEGVLRYFTLSREKKSKVVIHDFINRRNENLLAGFHPNVKLMLTEAGSISELAKSNPDDYTVEIERLHKEVGIGKSIAEAESFFRYMLWEFEPPKGLYFYLEDTHDELYKINVYDGEGEKINPSYSYGGNMYKLGFEEKPSPDWTLEILVENEDVIKDLKFSLENVDLP